ncbi:phosphoenolpyruvate carboxykinase (ATP) [Salibacter halophilus]|uniref:Phosphoenolpyruvate carboxykinase (ATP) n=1 Tax=Salibacter halophilus TaxID=1803916 RepID=A0A6N6M7B3_9FLAO|nr:phosphoenolpyruvate carboxykinase (ATP) [Salibacter halophilus]KAB1064503.1 phosphoenolpyruvate carboxykinase (ATP) [Salibacter halophilus]
MAEKGLKAENATVESLGIKGATAHWNLTSEELANISIDKEMAKETSTGAITVDTGKFTGRSPKDRFIVKDDITKDAIWWGDINIPFESDKFDKLYDKVVDYLSEKEIFVRDSYVCDHPDYRMDLRVVTEYPWSNLFAHNMFLRPTENEIKSFDPEWNVVCAPGFLADPEVDGTRQENFAILNFKRKIALIGGTGYTGEIKKGIFSALNFILPHQKNTLSMHCSANVGQQGDTAIFFGLSGTGKTTLSADPNRQLIGDDEHGWSEDNTVFNFEGGCYAKTIDLSAENEPDIWNAIKPGALLENVRFKGDTNEVDFSDSSVTENTRVSYPIYHINNIQQPSRGQNPKNIFFLTCDAFGVLPPISKLTPGQAAFHFISGYTAKVAGTEAGITEPQTTFSACFGAPFMPLHPTVYAEMLSKKMQEAGVNVWLINTGWSGGEYGTGSRIKLKYTRGMITAALNGELEDVDYKEHPVFGLKYPVESPGVPTEVLDARETWEDKDDYDKKANILAQKFVNNFEKFSDYANDEIMAGAPKVNQNA